MQAHLSRLVQCWLPNCWPAVIHRNAGQCRHRQIELREAFSIQIGKKNTRRTKRTKKRIPKVRLARPAGRPYQLRYTDSETGREVRISTATDDEAAARDQLADLQAKLRLGIEPRPQARIRHDGPS